MDPRRDNKANTNTNDSPQRRSERPRSFPPPPNTRPIDHQPAPPPSFDGDMSSARDSNRGPNDLSAHPAFQSSESASLPPPSGYIPPGQRFPEQRDSRLGYPDQQPHDRQEAADARFAPPTARPPSEYEQLAPRQPSPQHQLPPPQYSQAPSGHAAAHEPRPHLPAGPAPAATPSELPRRSSWGKTILKILGWTFLLSAILIALVLGGGLLTLRNAANQLLNPGTQQTFVTKAPVVASLKQVNKQIMIEHNNMVDVDYREAPEGWLSVLPIEQSFVVLLRGRVPAGFELSELTEDDVWISTDGSRIQLVLPPPVIFEDNVAVNFEESRVISEGDTCPDFICAQDLDAIQQVIIPQGRQLLIETSEKSGIMEQAAELGITYYESLLKSLGFEEIQVFIRSDVEIIQQTE